MATTLDHQFDLYIADIGIVNTSVLPSKLDGAMKEFKSWRIATVQLKSEIDLPSMKNQETTDNAQMIQNTAQNSFCSQCEKVRREYKKGLSKIYKDDRIEKIKKMVNNTKQNVLQLCHKIYEEIAQGKIPTNFVLPNLSNEDLDKWQDIYSQAMKDIAKEKGKREAFKEYHDLQKKLQEIYTLNYKLHDRIKKVQENEFQTVSVSDIQNEPEESFDLNSIDKLIEEEPKGEDVAEETKVYEKSVHEEIEIVNEPATKNSSDQV